METHTLCGADDQYPITLHTHTSLDFMLPSGEFIWARESASSTCVWLILSTHRSLLSCQWLIHFVCDQRFIAHPSLLFLDLPLSFSIQYWSAPQHPCSRTASASHWASMVLCSTAVYKQTPDLFLFSSLCLTAHSHWQRFYRWRSASCCTVSR